MKKILRSPKRIKFSDCDPMGHLYNAKFIQYLLDAREDQVETAYGFHPIDYVLKHGQGWIIVQNQISYLRAAMINESVICQSFIRDFNSRVMEVECTMWDADYKVTKAVLWTRFLFSDVKAHKASAHTPELLNMFGQVKVELDTSSFDDRVSYYRQMNKKHV